MREDAPRLDGPEPAAPRPATPADLAVVLSGGGARGAYQAGVLRALGRHFPGLCPPILTGISAGAINAAFLAAHRDSLAAASEDLVALWRGLSTERVLETGGFPLARNAVRWGRRLLAGGREVAEPRGLVDPSPLRELLRHQLATVDGELVGIDHNLRRGTLRAAAITTHDYATNQAVTWVQGKPLAHWEQPSRRSAPARLTVDHVMASAALPFLFPAVRLGDGWYGDGGIRLQTPLSPAIHLGATRLLAISNRYLRSVDEARRPSAHGYPPPALIVGSVLTALFLDAIDQDALQLERINQLVARLPPAERGRLRPLRLVVIRPSEDLNRLAGELERTLPAGLRFLLHGLGTHQIERPTFLSILLFEPEFLARLIAIGERDGEAAVEQVAALLADP
jgi:NTE family protein